jgi:hypothetical protein
MLNGVPKIVPIKILVSLLNSDLAVIMLPSKVSLKEMLRLHGGPQLLPSTYACLCLGLGCFACTGTC